MDKDIEDRKLNLEELELRTKMQEDNFISLKSHLESISQLISDKQRDLTE